MTKSEPDWKSLTFLKREYRTENVADINWAIRKIANRLKNIALALHPLWTESDAVKFVETHAVRLSAEALKTKARLEEEWKSSWNDKREIHSTFLPLLNTFYLDVSESIAFRSVKDVAKEYDIEPALLDKKINAAAGNIMFREAPFGGKAAIENFFFKKGSDGEWFVSPMLITLMDLPNLKKDKPFFSQEDQTPEGFQEQLRHERGKNLHSSQTPEEFYDALRYEKTSYWANLRHKEPVGHVKA